MSPATISRYLAQAGLVLPEPRKRPRSSYLVQDLHIRIIGAATGELLRELTLDPSRNYQPTGKPRRPKKKTP